MINDSELKHLCSGRRVFIWGAMIVGQGVCRTLERIGMPVNAFIDSSPSLQGKTALGYPICKPRDIFETVRSGKGLIIISSGHCDLEIADICQSMGLLPGVNYIFSRELNNLDPSVDIAGMCNLRCISCPRGNEKEQPPAGFMKAATYRKVLDKLLQEIPLLGNIQLYAWGEPLLNPDLPEIISMTREKRVLSAISSNLNYDKHLEACVAARPDWFKVSCSGWGDSYERTHTGGKWNVFIANLHRLTKLRENLHPDMQITVSYHLYKHNIGDDYRRMESLCRDLSLIFRPSPAYLYPVDTIMEYIDGTPLSPEARCTSDMLLMSLDEGLHKATGRISWPCPEERCFPINWDCRVRTCGVFFRSFIADNYLETPLQEILERRRTSQLCRECKKRALHQYTGVYLAEKRLYCGETP